MGAATSKAGISEGVATRWAGPELSVLPATAAPARSPGVGGIPARAPRGWLLELVDVWQRTP
jgi:hypothetical protein